MFIWFRANIWENYPPNPLVSVTYLFYYIGNKPEVLVYISVSPALLCLSGCPSLSPALTPGLTSINTKLCFSRLLQRRSNGSAAANIKFEITRFTMQAGQILAGQLERGQPVWRAGLGERELAELQVMRTESFQVISKLISIKLPTTLLLGIAGPACDELPFSAGPPHPQHCQAHLDPPQADLQHLLPGNSLSHLSL